MNSGREFFAMDESHDMHNEPHHGKLPPPFIPNQEYCNMHNPIVHFNNNHF